MMQTAGERQGRTGFANAHASDVADRRPDLGRASAVYPPGTVIAARHLTGAASAAMIVDYERCDAVSGTWHSPDLHYYDMTLGRRPPGALGRFVQSSAEARPVGPILFAPAGFHYAGQGGRGRQKSLAVVMEAARLGADDELDRAVEAGLPHCLCLDGASVRGLLARIAREVAAPGFASALLLDGLCLSLLVETARALRVAATPTLRKGGLSALTLKLIEERVQVVTRVPSLTELAALCGLSRRHLVRAFQAETGRTVGDYVQRKRLERAQQLLGTGDRSVAEVARDVGFASPAAFSTAFRRLCGQSPYAYRMSLGRANGR